ncbi:hypothetical protein MRX96_025381 [Rhipicephalus microplus]
MQQRDRTPAGAHLNTHCLSGSPSLLEVEGDEETKERGHPREVTWSRACRTWIRSFVRTRHHSTSPAPQTIYGLYASSPDLLAPIACLVGEQRNSIFPGYEDDVFITRRACGPLRTAVCSFVAVSWHRRSWRMSSSVRVNR